MTSELFDFALTPEPSYFCLERLLPPSLSAYPALPLVLSRRPSRPCPAAFGYRGEPARSLRRREWPKSACRHGHGLPPWVHQKQVLVAPARSPGSGRDGASIDPVGCAISPFNTPRSTIILHAIAGFDHQRGACLPPRWLDHNRDHIALDSWRYRSTSIASCTTRADADPLGTCEAIVFRNDAWTRRFDKFSEISNRPVSRFQAIGLIFFQGRDS